MSTVFTAYTVTELRERLAFYSQAIAQGPTNSLGHEGNPVAVELAANALKLIRAELKSRGVA